MKTIILKQPFAELVVSGVKDILNKRLSTDFRGTVLIYATSERIKPLDFYNIKENQRKTIQRYCSADCHTSSIIGSVEIVDCVTDHSSVWAEKIANETYHWVLVNPVRFEKPITNISFLEF